MPSVVYKAFKTRIYPTEKQKEYFQKCFGIRRLAYNWALQRWNEKYQNKEKISRGILQKEFNQERDNRFPFVYEVNSRIYRLAIDDLCKSWNNFFKNQSFNKPKLKTKKDNIQSFSTERPMIYNKTFSIQMGNPPGSKKRNRTTIKTGESIKFLKNKEIYRITISKKGNKYFVSFNYKELQNNKTYNKHKKQKVGIDVGLKTFLTLSNGETSHLPKKIKKLNKKIRKQQRILAKKQKGSKNYWKARTKLQNLYLKQTNVKLDFIHKLTTYICKTYKSICIEDLNIEEMKQSNQLNCKHQLHHGCLGLFKDLIKRKAIKFNNNLIIADRYFPSSKKCSNCGNIKNDLQLSDRVYKCNNCGYKIDRDLNAAINLENLI